MILANIENPAVLAREVLERERVAGPFGFNDPELHKAINRLWEMAKRAPVLAPLAFLAKIGGQIPLEQLEGSTLKTFLLANNLHHRMQATRLAVTSEGALPFVQSDGSTRWIPWRELRETEAHGQHTFYHHDQILFTTDKDYKLSQDYTYTQTGLRRYNIWTAHEPIHSFIEPPTGEFVLEVRSDIHHSVGEYGAGGCSGQHTFMLLHHPDGRVYAVGKYGPFDDIQCIDKVSPAGKKPGRVSFVDEYLFFPPGFAHSHSAKIKLTAEEYTRIFDAIKETHTAPQSFSLMNENCNSFVVDFVKTHCGLTIKNKMPLRVYFFKLLPRPFVEFAYKIKEKTYDKLPRFIRKGLSFIFFPLRYLSNVGASALGFLLSLFNREGLNGHDISLLDVIKGSGHIHHPSVFRDALRKMRDANGYIPRTA